MKAKKTTKRQSVAASPYRLLASLAFLSVVCVMLLIFRIAFTESLRYTFLFWNLILAIVPALIAWWLARRVRTHGWLKWQQIGLTALWVSFLPNSFYLITDLIHLRPNYEADILFDITLLTGFIMAGLAFGYGSIYLMHIEILKRLRERWAYGIVALLFVAVSFAVFLGRYMRWNTWDIVLRPAGLLFDISDRVINVDAHLQSYQITLVMSLLLFSGYSVMFETARLLKTKAIQASPAR